MFKSDGLHPRELLSENIDMFRYRNAISIPPIGMIDDLASVTYCGPQSVISNAIINAKINLKKLELNQTKCVKLHVAKPERRGCTSSESNTRDAQCAFLKVQESDMREAPNERYIGDIISSTGSNDANISRRRSIGMGAISDIFVILNQISMGHQYIEIGLILRESILMSKVLLSAESWHRVFQYQTEKLEEVDNVFLRKLFNCHSKTAIEFLISESGTIPVNIQMSARRLMYWWHILSVDSSELIFRVYSAQKLSPVSGDWVTLLEKDKQQFGMKLSDAEVAGISQLKFKKYVKKKSVELTVRYLVGLQKKNSKSKQLDVYDLTISPYLLDSRFSKTERELLFRLRSKTIWVKEKYSHAYLNNDMLCELCRLFRCTQSHPLQCPRLKTMIVMDSTVNLSENHVYGDVDQQLIYVKIYREFWDLREKLLTKDKDE